MLSVLVLVLCFWIVLVAHFMLDSTIGLAFLFDSVFVFGFEMVLLSILVYMFVFWIVLVSVSGFCACECP